MRPTPRLNIPRKQDVRNDTAYYIFDKKESLRYRTELSHVRSKYDMMDDPIYAQNKEDYMSSTRSIIEVYGPIIDMVDYYMEGATVIIADTTTAVTVYERIEAHLDAHTTAILKDKLYNIKDDFEVFEHLVSFGLQFWERVKLHYSQSGKDVISSTAIEAMLSSRPTFMNKVSSGDEPVEKKSTVLEPLPPLLEKLNRLEALYNRDRRRGY